MNRKPAELRDLSGLRYEFATEALPGALPVGRHSPQRCAYGLYAEQFTGSAFTARAAPTLAAGSIGFAPPPCTGRSSRWKPLRRCVSVHETLGAPECSDN